jgi:hypothetical protein
MENGKKKQMAGGGEMYRSGMKHGGKHPKGPRYGLSKGGVAHAMEVQKPN